MEVVASGFVDDHFAPPRPANDQRRIHPPSSGGTSDTTLRATAPDTASAADGSGATALATLQERLERARLAAHCASQAGKRLVGLEGLCGLRRELIRLHIGPRHGGGERPAARQAFGQDDALAASLDLPGEHLRGIEPADEPALRAGPAVDDCRGEPGVVDALAGNLRPHMPIQRRADDHAIELGLDLLDACGQLAGRESANQVLGALAASARPTRHRRPSTSTAPPRWRRLRRRAAHRAGRRPNRARRSPVPGRLNSERRAPPPAPRRHWTRRDVAFTCSRPPSAPLSRLRRTASIVWPSSRRTSMTTSGNVVVTRLARASNPWKVLPMLTLCAAQRPGTSNRRAVATACGIRHMDASSPAAAPPEAERANLPHVRSSAPQSLRQPVVRRESAGFQWAGCAGRTAETAIPRAAAGRRNCQRTPCMTPRAASDAPERGAFSC